MRAISIQFYGYKRLADTQCNTDSKMVAFLGPNEAGKSSVLSGLDWFSNGTGPLDPKAFNRGQDKDDSKAVVRVRYALDDEDRQIIKDLGAVEDATTFILARYPDGTHRTGILPALTQSPKPFEHLATEIARFEKTWANSIAIDITGLDPDDENAEPILNPWLDSAKALAAAHPSGSWNDEWENPLDEFTGWLTDGPNETDYLELDGAALASETERDQALADAINAARDVLEGDSVEVRARAAMRDRVPEFALFTQADRDLASAYELSDANLRTNPPQALANLIWVADLDLDKLWDAISTANTAVARTLERRANEALTNRLGDKWSQEKIDVQFNVNGSQLEILIVEKSDNGSDTPFSERSDGLRMFIALVAFLARHDWPQPPVLLVDEAETHLHYDAQADLIEVLTNDVEATQVFYTTHSPGCLPRDLGTGIRLVAPIAGRRDASELRNDFWTNERPGFTPLLFAMGAGAAAFSAFRRAVLTEGAADMILLPSLIRAATGLPDLPYQVAPGLANHHGSGLELEETAARVVYLLDGDKGGNKHRDWLIEAEIDEDRIFQFPEGTAPEDYVHPDRYLEVVNGLISSTGATEKVTLADLTPGIPISKAVADWCKSKGLRAPGKPAVASTLIGSPENLRLADGAKATLTDIHKRLIKALKG